MTIPAQSAIPHGISTAQLAAAIGGKPESIRVRLCRDGSYYGIRPARLPSGRLLWPADTVDRLLVAARRKNKEAVEAEAADGETEDDGDQEAQ
ncbi:MAG: monooxygenase [Nitrococcus sp.]|nr:monooxygenase [Nitrococcus sp.]